jgi:hypothetical protein
MVGPSSKNFNYLNSAFSHTISLAPSTNDQYYVSVVDNAIVG